MSDKFKFLSSQHIRTAQQYQKVFQGRQRCSGQYFGLYYLPNGLEFSRIGIITSKRNVRFAVKRNLVRRIVREQFRVHQSLISGYDIVFVAYREAAEASREELHQCIKDMYLKLTKRFKRRLSRP